MNNLRRIGINMISGGAGYILPMAINIISTPYVLSKLGEEAYGLQILANVIIGYLIVADMGLDIPITQKVAEYQAKALDSQQSKFLGSTLKIYFIIGLTGLLVLSLLNNTLITLLEIPTNIRDEAGTVFYLCGLGFFGSVIGMWGRAVFNGLHRYEISNAINVGNNLFGISLGIILIWNGYGIIGFFSARIVGFLISSLIYVILAGKHVNSFSLTPIIDSDIWQLLKKQIGYGFMLRLSGMIFSRMDQALISIWVGISAVTVYSFPVLIATSLSGLLGSLTHFTFPMASAMTATKSVEAIESFFLKITKFTVTVSSMAFLPFMIWGDKFLELWINPEIANQSHIVMVLLIASFYLNSCLNISVNAFVVGMGQLKYFTMYSITRGIFLFVGFFFLIKPFGIEGAGLSYLGVILVDSSFVLYTLRKKLNFDISHVVIRGYLKPVLLGLILGSAMIVTRNFATTWFNLIGIVSTFEILYIIIGYLIGILDDSDKKVIKGFFLKT